VDAWFSRLITGFNWLFEEELLQVELEKFNSSIYYWIFIEKTGAVELKELVLKGGFVLSESLVYTNLCVVRELVISF
jgi:hypothetical protein